jgi:hypothetical protein
VLLSPTPEGPTLPFPTAWPASGTILQLRIAGQQATNPTYFRQSILKTRRRARTTPPNQDWVLCNNYLANITAPALYQWTRAVQKAIADTWAYALTSAQQAAWTSLASANPVTNKYGTTKKLSGFGFFVRAQWMFLWRATHPGATPTVPFNPLLTTAPSTWFTLNTPSISNVAIYSGPPWPTGWGHPCTAISGQLSYDPVIAVHGIEIHMSNPNMVYTRKRCGPLFYLGVFGPGTFGVPPPALFFVVANLALRVHQNVTLLIRELNGTTWGESPYVWYTTATQPYPQPGSSLYDGSGFEPILP